MGSGFLWSPTCLSKRERITDRACSRKNRRIYFYGSGRKTQKSNQKERGRISFGRSLFLPSVAPKRTWHTGFVDIYEKLSFRKRLYVDVCTHPACDIDGNAVAKPDETVVRFCVGERQCSSSLEHGCILGMCGRLVTASFCFQRADDPANRDQNLSESGGSGDDASCESSGAFF